MKTWNRIHLFVALIGIFVASGIFNLVWLQHQAPTMPAESAATIRKEILQIHSVLLGGLMGGLFAKPARPRQQIKFVFGAVSIGFCLLWVAYIGAAWIGYPTEIGANGKNGLIDQFNDRASQFSALVAAALAYLPNKS